MKSFRKALSVILAMLMVFSLAAVSVVAETTPLEITKQPTVDDPTVEVNVSGVAYQWYVATSETVKGILTDADVRPIDNDSMQLTGTSSYDNSTGEWTPVTDGGYMEFFWIELSAGESITVVFSDEVADLGLGNYDTMNAFWGELNEDGSYTITVEEDGEFVLMAISDASDAVVTATAYGETADYAPIEGETAATLSSVEAGNKYYCEITRGDETLKSNVIKAEYEITVQPTLADPSVEVTFSEDASYQWCTAVKADVTVTDTTYGVTEAWGTYDSTLGVWTPYVFSEGGDYDVLYVFAVDLYVGDTVTLTVEGNAAQSVYFGNNTTMSGDSAVLNEDGTYTYTAVTKGNYIVIVEAPSEGTTVKATANTYRPDPIQGEVSSVLSEMTSGNTYLCQITYEDGTVLYTDHFKAECVIIKHPTAADPSVEVSFSDEVEAYQWYKKGNTVTEGEINGYRATSVSMSYVMELAGLPSGIPYTVLNEASYYDTALGAWIPASIEIYDSISFFGFTVDLEAGETLTVESVGSTAFDECALVDINDVNSSGYFSELSEDGKHVITVAHAATYILTLYVDTSAVTDIAFKAYGATTSSYEAIEGETASALSAVEYGEAYLCEVTYNDGTTLLSDAFKALPEIITQPTPESPAVEVTFEDMVVSYQWNKVEIGDKVITDEDAYPASYINNEQGSLAYYDSETQLWHPAYYSDWEETESVVVDGRIYFDNSTAAWTTVNIYCFDSETAIGFEFAWPGTAMTQIEGTDIWYYDVPAEYDSVIFNNNIGTQSGDLSLGTDFADEYNCYDISSDSFSLYEEEITLHMYEFDLFEIELNAGETLTIVPGEELYYGEIINSYDDNLYSDENGVYTYTAEEDVSLYLYARDDGDCDITFYVTVSNREILTPVEGATDSLFIPEESGTYICVITYEDGTVLTTDAVELDADAFKFIEGDVNNDGRLDMYDYLMIKSIYFGKYEPTPLEAYRADIYPDSNIDMYDYMQVKSLYFRSNVI